MVGPHRLGVPSFSSDSHSHHLCALDPTIRSLTANSIGHRCWHKRASSPEGKRCMATASLCAALVAPMPHKTRRGIHVFTATTTTITTTTTPPPAVVVVVGVLRCYYTSPASRTVT